MKIGVFGGTFNPPHNTHVHMALVAKQQLDLDKLVVMPCGDPPHKKCDVPANVRLELSRLAFGDFAEVSDFEIERQGKSYTVETLRHIASQYPDAELYLVIGADSLQSFGNWFCPDEIARLATLAVVDRERRTSVATVDRIRRDYGARIRLLSCQPDALSSTVVRLRYQFDLDNSHLVPEAVNRYALEKGLYAEYRAMAQKVRGYLTEKRYMHTFYVVKRGQELASEEKDKAFVACLLHDVAKYIDKQDYARYGFKQGDLPDSVVHSFLGARVAEQDFGIHDKEILDAIAYHTTGRPDMTRLDKIVYVADKTEDSRPYALSHLKRGGLDEQFVACLKEAYEVCLQTHCDSMCPLSEQTVAFYCPEWR